MEREIQTNQLISEYHSATHVLKNSRRPHPTTSTRWAATSKVTTPLLGLITTIFLLFSDIFGHLFRGFPCPCIFNNDRLVTAQPLVAFVTFRRVEVTTFGKHLALACGEVFGVRCIKKIMAKKIQMNPGFFQWNLWQIWKNLGI